MDEQVGPTKFVFTELHCGRCKYHKTEMIRSGRPALYYHYCTHEQWNDKMFFGEGRNIGERDITPQWCPITNPQEA